MLTQDYSRVARAVENSAMSPRPASANVSGKAEAFEQLSDEAKVALREMIRVAIFNCGVSFVLELLEQERTEVMRDYP